MKKFFVGLSLVIALTGCATRPTGQSLWNEVVKSEAMALVGTKPWTSHYADSYQSMTQLVAQPRVFALRDHFFEMLTYSRAMDAGKINPEEFNLIRARLEGDLNKRVANEAPMAALLPGEGQGGSIGAIVGAVGLGAAMGYSRAYQPPNQQITCTTGPRIGNSVQTICR